ncbi:uncharacterized protein CCOS01_11020, partial [Colletotrichum costaricense]
RKPAASEPPRRARVSSKASNESPRSRDVVNPWSNHEQIPDPSKLHHLLSIHPFIHHPRPPRPPPPPLPCRPASISIIKNLFSSLPLTSLRSPPSGPSSSPHSLFQGHSTHPPSSSLPFVTHRVVAQVFLLHLKGTETGARHFIFYLGCRFSLGSKGGPRPSAPLHQARLFVRFSGPSKFTPLLRPAYQSFASDLHHPILSTKAGALNLRDANR